MQTFARVAKRVPVWRRTEDTRIASFRAGCDRMYGRGRPVCLPRLDFREIARADTQVCPYTDLQSDLIGLSGPALVAFCLTRIDLKLLCPIGNRQSPLISGY